MAQAGGAIRILASQMQWTGVNLFLMGSLSKVVARQRLNQWELMERQRHRLTTTTTAEMVTATPTQTDDAHTLKNPPHLSRPPFLGSRLSRTT